MGALQKQGFKYLNTKVAKRFVNKGLEVKEICMSPQFLLSMEMGTRFEAKTMAL